MSGPRVVPILPPIGLSREEAARHVGVSPTLFDRMVAASLMPRPKQAFGRRIWDRLAVEAAFLALPGGDALADATATEDAAGAALPVGEANPWDEEAA